MDDREQIQDGAYDCPNELSVPEQVRDYRTKLPGLPASFSHSITFQPPMVNERSGGVGYDYTIQDELVDDTGNGEIRWMPKNGVDMYRYALGCISYPYGIPRDQEPAKETRTPNPSSSSSHYSKSSSSTTASGSRSSFGSDSSSTSIIGLSSDPGSFAEPENMNSVISLTSTEAEPQRVYNFKTYSWAN